jgi:hypothetical protein
VIRIRPLKNVPAVQISDQIRVVAIKSNIFKGLKISGAISGQRYRPPVPLPDMLRPASGL